MEKRPEIKPDSGKLGVLTPGMGAVATTFVAGVYAVRQGHGKPIGSLTQMGTIRLGKRTDKRVPLIKDFVPLSGLDDLVFGGWDIFEDDMYAAAVNAGVLDKDTLDGIKADLVNVKPMPAVFDQNYVKRISGTHVKKGKTKMDLADLLRQDIQSFKAEHKLSRLVMIWCASTEAYIEPGPVHLSLAAFEKGLKENDPAISPSMIYAYAALNEGVPFGNGAPNLTLDIPALLELSKQKKVPISGKDFKTGQTLMKTVLAPAFKARLLGVSGWFSTNILGNRDGEVLDEPMSFNQRKSANSVPWNTFYSPSFIRICTKTFIIKCELTTIRPGATTRKAGTILISLAGWGIPCRSRWISFAGIVSLQPPSCLTWPCLWIWQHVPA